jgi:hypothetical protein
MNWGSKLIIGMFCFMSMIVVFGVLMVRSKSDALVDTDYYEKGILYDAEYNKKRNVKQDHAEPIFEVTKDSLILTFAKPAEGKIKFIRMSNKNLDRAVSLQTESMNQAKFPILDKPRGLWKLQLDWQSADKAYIYEKEVMLP